MRLGSALAAGIILAVISNLAYASWDLPSAPIPPDSFKTHQEYTDFCKKLYAYYYAIGKPRLGRALARWDLPSAPTRPDSFKSHQEVQDYLTSIRDYYDKISKPRLGRGLTEELVANMSIAPQQVFSLIDTDHDNCVSLDEFQKFFS